MDPLELLTRDDKWFLGGGRGALFAPPFPRNLDAIGYWDESYLADVRLQRIFTTIFLDRRSRPYRFRTERLSWRPDRLELVHRATGIVVREIRSVLDSNAWVSELTLEEAPEPLDLFLWSLQDLRPFAYGTPWSSLSDCHVSEDSIGFRFETAWPEDLKPDRAAVESEQITSEEQRMLDPLSVYLEIGADRSRLSHTVNLAQRHDDSPLWETSMLPEKFSGGRLPGDFKLRVGPGEPEGLVHLLQHYRLAPGERIQLIAGAGLSAQAARSSFESAAEMRACEESMRAWKHYFAGVPKFESSDPWLTAAYWYRWYGLRLNTVDMEGLPICGRAGTFSPFTTEGVGFFRNFITYSAQAHLREVAWMHDSRLATGILENLGKCQREDGSFPGHNYSCRPSRDFYHADFTAGIRIMEGLFGCASIPDSAWTALRGYAEYFLRERLMTLERTGSGAGQLFLVFDQNETGQEYMSRYTAIATNADTWAEFRVGGVDASTYLMDLFQVLAMHEESRGSKELARHLMAHASRTASGLANYAWDAEDHFFCDVLQDGKRSPSRPLTGIYPLISKWGAYILWHNHGCSLESLFPEWIFNEQRFGLPRGFPADSSSDETFSSSPEWKGIRLNCPWNGRSWPMANSHAVDAVANFAREFEREVCLRGGVAVQAQTFHAGNAIYPTPEPPSPNSLDEETDTAKRELGVALAGMMREQAAQALMKAIRLMFLNDDPARPNSYEHYNPVTGTPATYRGYDDYMHSWIVDLIMRHAVGVDPGRDEVDPLPLDVDWITCTDIPHPRGRMNVRIERGNAPVVEIVEAKTAK